MYMYSLHKIEKVCSDRRLPLKAYLVANTPELEGTNYNTLPVLFDQRVFLVVVTFRLLKCCLVTRMFSTIVACWDELFTAGAVFRHHWVRLGCEH